MILYRSLREDLQEVLGPERISQDRHKRACCCWRRSYKILIQEPPRSIPEKLSYKHLIVHMAAARSSCKDLLERIFFVPRHNESDQSHERVALAISNTHRAAMRAI